MSTLLKYFNEFSSGFLISPWLNLNCNTSSYKTRTWCENMKTGDPIILNYLLQKMLNIL